MELPITKEFLMLYGIVIFSILFLLSLVRGIVKECKDCVQVNRSVTLNILFVRNGKYKASDYWLLITHINEDELDIMLQNGTAEIDEYGRVSIVKVDTEVLQLIKGRTSQQQVAVCDK